MCATRKIIAVTVLSKLYHKENIKDKRSFET